MFKKVIPTGKGKYYGLSLASYLRHPEKYPLPTGSQFAFVRHSDSSLPELRERMAAIGDETWGSRGFYRNVIDLTPEFIGTQHWYARVMASSQMMTPDAHDAAQALSDTLVAERIHRKKKQFLTNKEDIRATVEDIWKKFKKSGAEPYDEITKDLQQVHDLIMERARAGTYVPSKFNSEAAIDDMVVDIVAIKLTKIQYERSINEIVDDCFAQAVQDRKLVPLTIRRLEDRADALFAGGAASGKSTAIQHYAGLLEASGRRFEDTGLIFPDEYLPHFIDQPGRTDPDYLEVRTALTIDATQTMTDIAEAKIIRQRRTGVATDTIRETVTPSPDKLTYATHFPGGTISIFVTTADLDIIRHREQKRFERTSRRVPAHFLVAGASSATKETLRLFESLPGSTQSPIRVEIYDTSPCKLGDPLCSPTVIATIADKKSDLYIVNFDQLHRFVTKKTIITDPESGEITIPPHESIDPKETVESLLAHCQDHGSFYFVPLDTKTTSLDELRKEAYARFDIAANQLEILEGAEFKKIAENAENPLSDILKLLKERSMQVSPKK
ncbi:MAG: hypothetical protein AB7F64_04590 [Gammaproteobacteria bacterium]